MVFSIIGISIIATYVLIIPLPSASIIIDAPSFKRIVCYYTYPTTFSDLKPNNLDPNLCTHVLVGFAMLQNNSIVLSKQEENIIGEVVKLKKENSRLKVLLSVGGGGENSGFSDMVQNSSSRSEFILSFETILKKLNLDGIDLDWEFPNNLLKNEKKCFVQLLQDIRNSINKSVEAYLLSVAVAAPITLILESYDIPQINRYVDFVNIMSYDYNFFSLLTPWTGMNAPLYASTEKFYFSTQNINFTSQYWTRNGMSKKKINIGLPVYSHTYTLASPYQTYLGAPTIGNGKLGIDGSAKYGDICDFIKQHKLTPIFDEVTKSPYVTNGSEWVSYENDLSMKSKAEYVSNNDFGGVMVFSLSSDDYEGRCKPGVPFPNTRIIYTIFSK